MIETQAESCWRLVNPVGSDYEPYGEGTPHHHGEVEAQEYADRLRRVALVPDGVVLVAKRWDAPCVEVTCDGCGAVPDDDNWGTIHFPDEADARSMLDVYDFRADPDGHAWCQDCQGEPHVHLGADLMDCDRCGMPEGDHALIAAGDSRG